MTPVLPPNGGRHKLSLAASRSLSALICLLAFALWECQSHQHDAVNDNRNQYEAEHNSPIAGSGLMLQRNRAKAPEHQSAGPPCVKDIEPLGFVLIK